MTPTWMIYFLMSPSIPAAQVLLDPCAVALNWARISFRASNSSSLMIDKCKVIGIPPFSFISIIKLLISLSDDKHSVEKFGTEVLSGLKLVDKSSYKGIHKLWILQNMLIPRLCWPSQLLIALSIKSLLI